MATWWVTEAGKQPVGPMGEDAVIRMIVTGELPADGLVCVVGGDRWQRLDEVPEFASAISRPSSLQPFDDSAEKTIVDEVPLAIQEEDGDLEDERTEVGSSSKRRA